MIQRLLDDIRTYFESKSSLTTEEQSLLNRLNDGYFPIIALHRDNLTSNGFDVRKISDKDMIDLADKMAKDYRDQFFWGSMEVIAESVLDFSKLPECPNCGKKHVIFDSKEGICRCQICGQNWHDDLYVLAQNPDDTSRFEQEYIGYPSLEKEDRGAYYVPEYEYILQYQKNPEPNNYYRPVCWPESKQYLPGGDYVSVLNECIKDEFGLNDFGDNAVWVALDNLHADKSTTNN